LWSWAVQSRECRVFGCHDSSYVGWRRREERGIALSQGRLSIDAVGSCSPITISFGLQDFLGGVSNSPVESGACLLKGGDILSTHPLTNAIEEDEPDR
jgi:hypothetical protein